MFWPLERSWLTSTAAVWRTSAGSYNCFPIGTIATEGFGCVKKHLKTMCKFHQTSYYFHWDSRAQSDSPILQIEHLFLFFLGMKSKHGSPKEHNLYQGTGTGSKKTGNPATNNLSLQNTPQKKKKTIVPHKAVAEDSKMGNPWEVGGCESWMAGRTHWWTARWLECRVIYRSISLSVCLPACLPTCLSACLSIDLFIYLSIYLPNLN